MPLHQSRRHRGADPALLRQLRGEPPIAAVDQPATAFERAFAALTTTTMVLVSAYIVFM